MPREFQHIVRMAGTDLDGTLKVNYALTRINGIGITLANAIIKKANINSESRIGYLTETDIDVLEDVMTNPPKHDLPGWMFNRQKDVETGKDTHLIGADLALRIKTDIEGMKSLKSWRGYRHAHGLRVRGQRTRTTGRKAKALGVKKRRAAKREAT